MEELPRIEHDCELNCEPNFSAEVESKLDSTSEIDSTNSDLVERKSATKEWNATSIKPKRRAVINPSVALILLALNSFVFVEPFFLKHLYFDYKAPASYEILAMLLAPLAVLFILKYYKLLAVLRTLATLNLFILLVMFFMLFNSSYLDIALLFCRYNLIMLFSLLLFYKEDAFYLAYGLQRFGKLSLLLFFTLKFFIELNTLREQKLAALRLRSFSPRLMPRLKAYAYLIVSLILESKTMSENMSVTLRLRGFVDRLPVFTHYKIGALDVLLLTLCLLQGVTCYLFLT